MSRIIRVDLAEPYRQLQMGSLLGRADGMLLCQYNFPLEYDSDKDKLSSAWLDRMKQWDAEHVKRVFEKYNLGNRGIEKFLTNTKSETILDFILELQKEKVGDWTGYRVMETIGANGYPYYVFQLFSKHPETKTKVYSGQQAPNVKTLE